MTANEKVLRTYIYLMYGDCHILNYEEARQRCYLRFMTNSNFYLAEKTKEHGSQIMIYKLDRSISNYE